MKQHKMEGKLSLSSQAVILLMVNGLFVTSNALSGTFVNVFLWKAKNDFSMIGWFAFAHQLFMAFAFLIAGKWVKEHNKMNSLRLGVTLSAVFYLLVLLLKQRAISYVFVLGAVQGMGAGFFWIAFNVVYFEVTDPENRDKFNGMAGLFGSGAGMLAPWMSGILITEMKAEKGYTVIFTISLIIFVIGAVVSFFLKKREVSGTYDWRHSVVQLRDSKSPWREVCPALMFQGIREGVFGFAIGLLVYISTKSEWNLGNYALITSAVGFISFFAVGRFLKPKSRRRGALWGAVIMVAVIFPFFWRVDYMTLLMFGIATAIFFPLYTIPMTSSVFDIIGQDQESAERRVEYVVLRELSLITGRMSGILIFIVVVLNSTMPLIINFMLLGIGSSPIFAWTFMRKHYSSRFRPT